MNRPPYGGLTEDEIAHISDDAAKKALNIIYQEIGKSVLRKAAWLLGVALLSLIAWLGGKDLLK